MSEVLEDNEKFRIDSEFFKREYLEIEEKIKKINYKKLSEVECNIIHPKEIKREFVENGIWFFRTQNLRPLKIDTSSKVFISEEDSKILKKMK